MFCVLNIEKREKTLLEKVFRFLSRDEYSIKTIPVFKGAPFYILTAKVSDNVDWNYIVEAVGKCSKKLLINQSIQTPENKNIGVFHSRILYNKVFQNTMLQILKNNINLKSPQSIAVYDKKGEYKDFVVTLLPYASTLKVITENKQKYLSLCDKVLADTGICISLLSRFDDSKVKIDTERNIMSVALEKEFLNLSSGENALVEDTYKKLLPQGVNPYDFYSALYELCGVFSLGGCIFEEVCVNNEKKRVDTITFS